MTCHNDITVVDNQQRWLLLLLNCLQQITGPMKLLDNLRYSLADPI